MEEENDVLTGEHFFNGDVACAEGAIACGCRFFGGYPITPATEVAERMSQRLPKIGGIYIQMEDEIASMCAVLGAAWGGMKAMSSTSGPGFSLMMESIGLGIMTETPCVLVNVQRGGPSTGLPTLVGQSDMMQARWGTHGDFGIIAYTPSSPQEMFNYTVKAFNMSEKYRLPVLVMSDEMVGHMTEKVVIPDKKDIPVYQRRTPKTLPSKPFLPYLAEEDLVPPMACAGEGYRIHVTGLTHDERGYPMTDFENQEKLVKRLIDKIKDNSADIIEYEERFTEDAEIIVTAYGISARSALKAVRQARGKGVKAGYFRFITAWPFPQAKIRELAGRVKAFVMPEINYGQMVLELERCVGGRAKVIPLGGVDLHPPAEILEAIMEVAA